MRPVPVREILTSGERLGITEIVETPGALGSVCRLLRHEAGESVLGMAPFPCSLLILPSAADGAYEKGWNGSVIPSLFRNVCCLALPAQRITAFLRQWSERTETPIFSSCYDDSLLHSRLTGLLRERGARQIMVHGVLVRVCDRGVLILGESGIGKTACGLALMSKDNLWVADDAVILEGRGDAVYGRGHPRTGGRIAVRGRGVLMAADLLGVGRLIQETRVDLLVRLVRGAEGNALQEGESFQEIVGVFLRCRDLAADIDPKRMAERVEGYLRRLSVKSPGYQAAAEEQRG